MQSLNPLLDGLEVSEGATQPALVDEKHVTADCFINHSLLCLLLRPHKEDALAISNHALDEGVSLLELTDSLLQVDNVDAIALHKDIWSHLGVPTPRLVPEVHTSLEQLLHADYRHGNTSFVFPPHPSCRKESPAGDTPLPIGARV